MENIRDVVSSKSDIVNYLLLNKFNGLTYDDKVFTKRLPIPRPLMLNLIQAKDRHSWPGVF